MPEIYIIIGRKNIFPNFRGGGDVPSLPPVSYAYEFTTTIKVTICKEMGGATSDTADTFEWTVRYDWLQVARSCIIQ